MKRRLFKNTDWGILICVILLIIIGLIALYSASLSTDLTDFKKQIVWIAISIPIMIVVMIIDYNTIARFSPYLYGLTLILLVGVLFTPAVNGASSWFELGFFRFQPGEIGKILVIIFLAYMFVYFQKKSREDINRPTKIGLIMLIALVPVILLAIQPDYGTALAYIVSLILMLFVAGINKKYIIISILVIAIMLPVLYFFILPEHAVARIDVYLNPELDPRGAGYNIIQSKIAIGAGKLFGMGYLQGTQTHLGFLYPKTTDFIFPVIGEELGFIACRSNSSRLCSFNH